MTDPLIPRLRALRTVLSYPENGIHYCRWCDAGSWNQWQHREGCIYVDRCAGIDRARETVKALLASAEAATPMDLTNHHNALTCPHCNPKGLKLAHEAATPQSYSPKPRLRDVDGIVEHETAPNHKEIPMRIYCLHLDGSAGFSDIAYPDHLRGGYLVIPRKQPTVFTLPIDNIPPTYVEDAIYKWVQSVHSLRHMILFDVYEQIS